MVNPNSVVRGKAQPLRERLRVVAADAILQAAEQVFSEQGLHAAKMETIAARAGVAVGTLYNHFEDRHALLAALVEERREAVVRVLDRSLENYRDRPFEEQLLDFITSLIGHFENRGSLAALVAEAEPSPVLRKQKAATVESVELRARELFKRGVQYKEIDVDRAQWLHVLLMGMLRGAIEHSRELPETRRTAEAWGADMVALILHGAGH